MSLDDEDLRGFVDGAEPFRGNGIKPPSPYRPRLPSELEIPKQPKLIRKLMGEAWIVIIYGDFSSGKSFLGVDLACCIAAGKAWRERMVTQGAVVYWAGEAHYSIDTRIQAWNLRYYNDPSKDLPIGVTKAAPNLLDDNDTLGEAIREATEFANRVAKPLRLIVIDTVHAAAPGSREDARDTGRVLASVRRVVQETGASVLLIHHSGKEAGRGARGSNALEAGADLVLEVREQDEVRAVFVRKMRDAEVPDLWPFQIESVTLRHDVDGEPITSAIAVAVEPKPSRDDADLRKRAKALRAGGQSFRKIEKTLGVGKSTVERWLKADTTPA